MTVGIAYRVPGEGCVLVSDGRITCDGEILTDTARKFVICGSTAAVLAGTVGALWGRLQDTPPKSFAALREAVEASDDDTDWLAYDRKGDHLWLGDVRLTTPFACIGTGASTAHGALAMVDSPKSLDEAIKLCKRSVKVVCARHTTCGGKVRTIVVRGRSKPIEIG